MKEVKIVRFFFNPKRDHMKKGEGVQFGGKHLASGLPMAEQELAELLNDGWQISAAGGGDGMSLGFVVLIRDRP
jgi:hypothetical protein